MAPKSVLNRLACTGAMVVSTAAAAATNTTVSVDTAPHKVKCKTVSIPSLTEVLGSKSARICYPDGKGKWPLHLFSHGDLLGGKIMFSTYHGIQEQISSYGFVVAAYLSCGQLVECDHGMASFLEVLKTIAHLEAHKSEAPIDFSKHYSISGHSTGGRVALQLAALKDSPSYMSNRKEIKVDKSLRAINQKIHAFIGDHPDPMYHGTWMGDFNPDTSSNYRVSKSPVFLMTGSKDQIEPKDSCWKDFAQLSTPDKVFVNFEGDGHMEPTTNHHTGPLIAYFSRCHVLAEKNSCDKIYGTKTDSLGHSKLLAKAGSANNGPEGISFLACSSKGANPSKHSKHCHLNHHSEKTDTLLV